MDNQLILPSPDGSSNRNSPETSSRPFYSTQVRQRTLRCYQYKKLKHMKTEVKEETEKTCLRDDECCKEEDVSPEISPDPGDIRDIWRNVKAEEEEEEMKIKEEESPPEISTALGNTRTSWRDVKAEVEGKQAKTKKILEIGIDGRYRWYNREKHPIKSPDGEIVDDDITAYVAEEKAVTPNLKPVSYKAEKPFSCPDCGKRFTHESYLIIHHRSHTGEKPFVCSECGKRFTYKCSLAQHLAAHKAVWAFPCPECGKRFRTGWILAAHRRLHSSEDIQR